jgi:hypothetical protein
MPDPLAEFKKAGKMHKTSDEKDMKCSLMISRLLLSLNFEYFTVLLKIKSSPFSIVNGPA